MDIHYASAIHTNAALNMKSMIASGIESLQVLNANPCLLMFIPVKASSCWQSSNLVVQTWFLQNR